METTVRYLSIFWRTLRRTLRDPQMLIIGCAITIAVASVSAVDTFTDRVRRAMNLQANALLAADLAIISSHPLPNKYTHHAGDHNLATAQTTAMRSVVSHGDQLQLVELKAVSQSYPLRGEVVAFKGGKKIVERRGPPAGGIWVEQRLLDLLSVQEGARVTIGAFAAVIDGTLLIEPDRAGSLFNLAPRVMMNLTDLPTTQLVLPGSRLTHSLLVTGKERDLEEFRNQLTLRDTDTLRTPDQSRPEVKSAIERADHFLNLAALTAIILAATAIALAAQTYAAKNTKPCAVLRVLGATRAQTMGYFLGELIVIAVLGIAFGIVIGILTQHALALMISGWVQGDLPAARASGALRAVFIGCVALFGFAAPYLYQLPQVSPALLLRPTMTTASASKKIVFIYALVAFVLIAPWHAGNMKITAITAIGIMLSLLFIALLSQSILGLLYGARKNADFSLRFGITNLWRKNTLTRLQTAALGLGLTALFTLSLVRTEILGAWIDQVPAGAPNQFLINIQPEEQDHLREFFVKHGLPAPQLHPMIRARLSAINGEKIDLDDFADERAKRLASREFNLSWNDELKPDNKIVAGRWWQSSSQRHEFSFEKGIADSLGLKNGDVIEYTTAGEKLVGEITSLREVQWETMGVNFFVEGTPALLDGFPATYITSLYLPPNQTDILSSLVREFPSVTTIDVSALITQVRTIMERASKAIEFVSIFTLLAGIIVLIAAAQATQNERAFTTNLLKTLGGGQKQIFLLVASEFVFIGALAGTTAAISAQLCAWLIAERVLTIPYEINYWLIPIGALIAISIMGLIGAVAVRSAFSRPARELLNPPW